jgi:hypothetical protein
MLHDESRVRQVEWAQVQETLTYIASEDQLFSEGGIFRKTVMAVYEIEKEDSYPQSDNEQNDMESKI